MTSADDYFIRAADLTHRHFVKSGAFGDVYKAYYFEKPVAVKEIKITGAGADRERMLKALQLEVDVLRNARHPNITLFMGASFAESKPFIVTEWATHGNLEEVLKKGGLDQATKVKFAIDVALGMMYLHGRKPKIAHLDLKPDNLLVFSENTIKICDFGLSRPLGPEDATSTMGGRGSPHYMAPECIDVNGGDGHRSNLSHKSDVFSYAMVLYRMFAGQHPFRSLLHESRAADWLHVFMARQNQPLWRPDIPNDPSVHPGIWDITQQCWHPDPARRPPFEVILRALREIYQAVAPAYLNGRPSVASSPSIHRQPSNTLTPSIALRQPPHSPPLTLLPPADAPVHASAGSSYPTSSLPSSAPPSSTSSVTLPSLPSNATLVPPISPFFHLSHHNATASTPSRTLATPTLFNPPPHTASSSAPPDALLSSLSSLTAPASPSLTSLRHRYSAIPTAEFDRLAKLFTKCDVYYTGCVTSATLQTELKSQGLPSPTTRHLAARLRNRAVVLGSDELLSLDNFLQHAHDTCIALDAPPAAPAPSPSTLASLPSASVSAYGGRYPYLPQDYISQLKAAFARLDCNNDGKLLRNEILDYAAGQGGDESRDFASKLLQQLQENRLVTYFTVDQLLESANKAAYEFFLSGDSSSAATLPFPLDSTHLTSSGSLATTSMAAGSPPVGEGSLGGGAWELGRLRHSLDRGGAAGGPPLLQDLEAKYRGRLTRDKICDWWRYFCELDSQRDGVLTRTEVMAAHWTDANGNQVMEPHEVDAAAGPLLQLLDGSPRRPVTFPVFLAWAADTHQPAPNHGVLYHDVKHSAHQSPFAQDQAPRGATLVRNSGRVARVPRTGTDKLVFEQLRDILGSEPSSALTDDTYSPRDRDDHSPDSDDDDDLHHGAAGARHDDDHHDNADTYRFAAPSGHIRGATSVPDAAQPTLGRGAASAMASAPGGPGYSTGLRRSGAYKAVSEAPPLPALAHPPDLAELEQRFKVPRNTILAHWSLFRKVDINGDGQASIEELEAALHQKDLQALFVSLMYMFEQSEGRSLRFAEFLQLALEAKHAPTPPKVDVETLANMSSRQLLQAFLKRMKRKLLG